MSDAAPAPELPEVDPEAELRTARILFRMRHELIGDIATLIGALTEFLGKSADCDSYTTPGKARDQVARLVVRLARRAEKLAYTVED